MSKSTKIIAALGLAAGLGVASIPVATFAAPSITPYAVNGNVDLYVEIPTAIAMTIKGNNDDDSLYRDGSLTHVSNRSSIGYNVNGINVYDGYATDDTEDPAAHADTGTVDGHQVTNEDSDHILNKTGSLKSSSYAFLNQNDFTVGTLEGTGTNGGFKSTITVYTNNGTGYNLNASGIQGGSPDLTMTAGASTDAPQTYTIPAAAIAGQAGTSGWGYKTVKYMLDGVNADNEDRKEIEGTTTSAAQVTDSAFSEMPAYGSARTIDSLDKATKNGRQTVVLYGVQTSPDQAAGVYKTTLLYTATTK